MPDWIQQKYERKDAQERMVWKILCLWIGKNVKVHCHKIMNGVRYYYYKTAKRYEIYCCMTLASL